MCLKCLDMIPSKIYKPGTNPPWMNSTIKRLSHRKQRLCNFVRSSKCNDAWQRYRQIKKEVLHVCRQAHNSNIQYLVTPGGHATIKKLWTYIKNQRKNHCGVPPLLKGDKMISDAAAKAKLLMTTSVLCLLKRTQVISHTFKAYQSL